MRPVLDMTRMTDSLYDTDEKDKFGAKGAWTLFFRFEMFPDRCRE